MFSTIVVPFDGSSLAESVLPAAAFFRRRFQSRLVLLHVVEKKPPKTVHGQRHLGAVPEAQAYLAGVKARWFADDAGVTLRVEVARTPKVAAEVARVFRDEAAQLLILCTHGGSGLTHLVQGSIAQQAMVAAESPLLLIHPGRPDFAPARLLVPLDGSPEHEPALRIAEELGRRCGLPLELLNAVPTPGSLAGKTSFLRRLLPVSTGAFLEMEEKEAGQYLTDRAAELQARGVQALGLTVRGEPAAVIRFQADSGLEPLTILATHGNKGFGAYLEGSVAGRLALTMYHPLLLVPVSR